MEQGEEVEVIAEVVLRSEGIFMSREEEVSPLPPQGPPSNSNVHFSHGSATPFDLQLKAPLYIFISEHPTSLSAALRFRLLSRVPCPWNNFGDHC